MPNDKFSKSPTVNPGIVYDPVGFHMGRTIISEAQTYGTLELALLEVIQNEVDANAKSIQCLVNLHRRYVKITGNGDGAPPEKIRDSLGMFNSSQKVDAQGRRLPGMLGRWGKGFAAPIDKADEYTFTATAKDGDGSYYKWTFRHDEIKKAATLSIPRERLSNYEFGKKMNVTHSTDGQKKYTVNWRTMTELRGVTTDKNVSKMPSAKQFAEEVFDRFGTKMRKLKTKLSLHFIDENGQEDRLFDLEAQPYRGKALERHVSYMNGRRTFFELYLAPEKGEKVYVRMTGDEFRLPFNEFVKNTVDWLDQEVVAALKSGVFTGEIETPSARLHKGRKYYEPDDFLQELCQSINQWFVEVGSNYYSVSAERDERNQKRGEASLKNLQDLLQTPEFEHLALVVNEFRRGRVRAAESVVDVENSPGLTSVSLPSKKKGSPVKESVTHADRDSSSGRSKNKKNSKLQTNPQGRTQNIIRDEACGLQFCHDLLPGQKRLWALDERQGILTFNIRHPTWQVCEGSDKRIQRLQESIAICALQSVLVPDHIRSEIDEQNERMLESLAMLLRHSPSFK